MEERLRPGGSPRLRGLPSAVAGLFIMIGAALLLSAHAAAIDPPIAVINEPNNGQSFDPGDEITFSANGSFDPDQNQTTYPMDFIWNVSGQVLQGVDLKVVRTSNFTIPGNYTIGLTVIDNESLEGYANVTITIRPPNEPPVAAIASPASGARFFDTQFVSMSAEGSFDPEGGSVSYFWSSNLSGQLGTGKNLSVRLPVGAQALSVRAVDNRGDEATATVSVVVETNQAPFLTAGAVSPTEAFVGQTFSFTVRYEELNGEAARNMSLILDNSTHAMALVSGADPRAGQVYGVSLAVAAGVHFYYFRVDDGNLSNFTASTQGPRVWQNITVVSADGLAVLRAQVLPPHNFSLINQSAAPVSPPGLVPVSKAYTLVGAAPAGAANFSLTLSFAASAQLNRSSAQVHSAPANLSEWIALVSSADPAGNTASVTGAAVQVQWTYRVFAQRLAPSPNQPPQLVVAYSGAPYPNETIDFDATNSTDPESGRLIVAWKFEGPGVSTDWIAGSRVAVAFPWPGTYNVSLRGDDGSGSMAYRNITVDVRPRPVIDITPPDEVIVLASLAAAVLVSAVLAMWWRSRAPVPKRSYDDLYGRAYKMRMWDEREYAEIFRRFAVEPREGAAPPEELDAPGAPEGPPEEKAP